ncbi:MAG: hypothetical protein KJP07_11605, partial [Desulfatitalea sp.]|nr:hypothetical protein [Desulfatitalea sp.]
VCKAHPPVHIRICTGGCNAADGLKDKQDWGIIFFLRLKQLAVGDNEDHAAPKHAFSYAFCGPCQIFIVLERIFRYEIFF